MTKVCPNCKVEKPITEYYVRSKKKGVLTPVSWCKPCCSKQTRKYQEKHKNQYIKYSRKSKLKKKYGITSEQYDSMLLEQNNCCGICKKETITTLCIDHCHSTGKVRGLLCQNCNLALGKVKDNIEVLKSAIEYLEKANRK